MKILYDEIIKFIKCCTSPSIIIYAYNFIFHTQSNVCSSMPFSKTSNRLFLSQASFNCFWYLSTIYSSFIPWSMGNYNRYSIILLNKFACSILSLSSRSQVSIESSQKLYLAIKNAQIGKLERTVPHIIDQNARFPDLFFMNECSAINDPMAIPHFIALKVNGYLKMYFALRQSNFYIFQDDSSISVFPQPTHKYIFISNSRMRVILIQQELYKQCKSKYHKLQKFNKRIASMGIPRFYKWLRTRYPLIRMDLIDANKQAPIIDNLYLDFNGIVYRCLSDFQCFLKNKFDPISFQEIYQRVYHYMMVIIEKVNPQKLIFIAFDGVAPRAKINQSRDRRFRAIKDRQSLYNLLEKLNIEDKQKFQQNSISPGTEFLTNLCIMLKKRIMGLFQTQWKHLRIFFSDCRVPGEGQHKIMDFLRHSKRLQLCEATATHCVYSADADVILLCSSLNIKNICIIREDSTKNNFGFTAMTAVRSYPDPQFQYIFINILREYFQKQFKECLQAVKSDDVQPIINDFILLMAFVGNDFLPVEFCFTIKETHMENLFKSYKEFLNTRKKFINNLGVIDWVGIEQLLQIAKKFQANMLQQKIKNKRNLINQRQMQKSSIMKEKSKQQEEQEKSEDDQVQKFEVVDEKIVKGRDVYYKTRFGIQDTTTDPKFKDIIIKYIQGLQFYNQYYFCGVSSWVWNYPYHYTPLLTDVYDYISSNKVNIKLNKGQPFDPVLALMFMLPESSFHLMPKQVADALKDPNCALRTPTNYFPNDFKLDKYENLQFHKRALIPFLKQDEVRKVYQNIDKSKFTENQKERNSKGNTIYFKFIGPIMSGSEIYFGNQASEKDLVKFFKQTQKKQKENNRERFPSLSINGQYEIQEKGRIQVTRKYKYEGNPNELVFYNNFIGYIEDMEQCLPEDRSQISKIYYDNGIQADCTNIYRIKQARKLRETGRFSYIKTFKQVKIPDFAVFKLPKYEYISDVYNFQMKEIYNVGERVILLNQKYFGNIGVLEKLNDKTAQIRITDSSSSINFKIQQNQQQFYLLKDVANQLSLNPATVLAILDQVIILPKTNRRNQNDDVFPTGVNMGLNIINSQKGLLLPHYARCQMKYENTQKVYEIFRNIQLSERCKSALKEYISNFEDIVDYLEDSIQEGDFSFRKGIFARNIYDKEQDVNLRLYSQFVRLYKFSVQGKFYSIYSKVSNQELPPINSTERIKQPVIVPYHEFISKQQARICPPALKAEPQFHDIGDRVVLTKLFEVGFVVGIDDFNVWVKLSKKQQPVRVSFIDAFNSKWCSYLVSEPGKCWNMEVSFYSPQHYSKVYGSEE